VESRGILHQVESRFFLKDAIDAWQFVSISVTTVAIGFNPRLSKWTRKATTPQTAAHGSI